MKSGIPKWVEQATALPVAFAQVREDALMDLRVVDHLAPDANVIMIASGGCTAAALASSPRVSRLHLVDPNPAQIALTRLKLRLLQVRSPRERLAILGHIPMPTEERKARLRQELRTLDLPDESLGPFDYVGKAGPDQAGRLRF